MFPQLPDDICKVIQELTEGLRAILTGRLVALYVGGSLTAGDFCESSSDIDFLVVTRDRIDQEDGLAIAQLHAELCARHPWASRLEGDYVPIDLLVPEGSSAPVPGCEHGRFLPKVGEIMLSADTIANMRECGLAFHGEPPTAVLPPVSGEHVRCAVRQMLLDGVGPCDSPSEAASEVLNLVRSVYALQTGRAATKSAGARWGLAHLDARWHPMIRSALIIRCGQGTAMDEGAVTEGLRKLEKALRPYY